MRNAQQMHHRQAESGEEPGRFVACTGINPVRRFFPQTIAEQELARHF